MFEKEGYKTESQSPVFGMVPLADDEYISLTQREQWKQWISR